MHRFPFHALALACLVGTACTPAAAPPDATVGDAALDAVFALDSLDAADTLGAASQDTAPAPPPVVVLAEGAISGSVGPGYREFWGIPYAAPPVGALRWTPPSPPAAWTGTRDGTIRPQHCPQILAGFTSGDEDCLYANVDTPDPPPQNAPVMVWLHGGAFIVGEGLQVDDGTRGDVLAAMHGVIVVSINYRLGPLGFLAHPALTAEGSGHSGNYGLLDQVAALQWVHTHIAAFGGDPNNVTLFGESAGGMSVCGHMVSPLSTGLFQRAVIESGPCGLPAPTLASGEAQGQVLATALGCASATDVAACMRAASMTQVIGALPVPPGYVSTNPMYAQWFPVVDGAFFTQPPMTSIRAGTFQRVPLLFGWNDNEGTLLVMLASQTNLTAAQYPGTVLEFLGGNTTQANAVLAQYPLSAYASPFRAYSAVFGDYFIACPSRRVLTAMAPFVPSAFAYHFTYPNAAFLLGSPVPLGAFHSAEVQYVFGHPGRLGQESFSGVDETLNQTMMGYWTRFATADNPNGAGAVAWPAYTAAADTYLQLDVTQQPLIGASAAACAFWESLGVYD